MVNPKSPELNEAEMSNLFRLVAGWLVLNAGARIESIDIPMVNQRPGDEPREFILDIPPGQYVDAFNVNDEAETVDECQLLFTQDHLIEEFPYDQPIPAHLNLNVKSRVNILGEILIKNEWFVIVDPESADEGVVAFDSYVGIEYSRPSGEKLMLSDEQAANLTLEGIYQDIERSRRTINQADAMHFRRLIELMQA